MAYRCNTGMANYPGPGGNGSLMVSTAMSEKREMGGLNDRLAGFMDKIREMCKMSASSVDPSQYHEMLRMLEAEIAKLKGMYEDELNRLRRQLEEANRQAGALAANANNNRDVLGDIQGRLREEAGRAQKAENDINNLNRMLAQKEKDLADLMAACKAKDAELDRLRPENAKLARENEDLKRQLDMERKLRQEAENKARVMGEKINFDGKVFGEQQKDLGDRIRAANDIIQTLENKLRQLSNDRSNSIPQMLQRLRDGTAEDMRKFQRETEEALNNQLHCLKQQMDDDASMKDRLAREKAGLEDALRNLQARCNALEGDNQGLRNENNALKMGLDREKAQAAQQARDYEGRLRDCQGQLMNKVKDFNTARDAQASLKVEIDQYRGLLDVGNNTLQNCPIAGQCGVPQTSGSGGCFVGASSAAQNTVSPRAQPTVAPPSYSTIQLTSPSNQRPMTARACCSPCESGEHYSKGGGNRVTTSYVTPTGCGPSGGLPQIGAQNTKPAYGFSRSYHQREGPTTYTHSYNRSYRY